MFGYECTRARAGETENRDQVGLLRSNMLPLSFSLLHPLASFPKTPSPSGHTCGQHTRNIHKQSSISRTMPVISGSNESLPGVPTQPIVAFRR